jgi:tetratricopeptide (TPR) repeat protein
MKTTLIVITLLSILVGATGSLAQTAGVTSPFGFGVGSRDLALGGADVASCDFATAAYWNPARLAQSEKFGIMGFHTRLYESDVAYQYLGIVIPTLDWGAVGIGVTRLGIDGIEKRDASNLFLDTITDSRLSVRVGYGRAIGSLDIGMSLSLETHSLDTYKATSTPGLDVAATRTLSLPFAWCENVSLTLVGRNLIAPSMRLADESIKTPFEFQAGLSTKLLMSHDKQSSLELFGSVSKPNLSPTLGSVGVECSLFDILQLRGSFRDDAFSGGAGISYHGISVDYALVDRELGALHVISLTTNFGRSVSERRTLRAERREAAFNRAMSDRLTQKNIDLASQLLDAGKSAMAKGDLAAADASFDRALFLARSSGIDTSAYAALAEQVRAQILQTDRSSRIEGHLDSARTHLADLDYLGCQYFAGLALSLDSTSVDAIDLRNTSLQATAEAARQQEFIQQRVWLIDSLISYGATAEALAAAQSVSRMAADIPLVQIALKKAEFEFFKAHAETDLSAKEYRQSMAWLDSALVRFPGQARCLELKQMCRNELSRMQAASAAPAVESAPVSREAVKQAQTLYEKAQAAFSRGELTQAIAVWEEVDRLVPGFQSVREYLLKAYRFVGVDLYGQNRLREALEIWEKALKVAPDNAEITAYERRTRNEIEKLKELSYDN